MQGTVLPGGGGMRGKGIEAGKLGMRFGNSYLSDLISTLEIYVKGRVEIGMGLQSGGPQT